jgi:hypothetical protein
MRRPRPTIERSMLGVALVALLIAGISESGLVLRLQDELRARRMVVSVIEKGFGSWLEPCRVGSLSSSGAG